jgi:predicted nucleic acid-binding protein
MIVVADSSPLQYLILLDETRLLEHFYKQVFVPDAVAAELRWPGAPGSARAWMLSPPSWITVAQVTADEAAPIADWLDSGERAAIALAERLHADVLLIDEKDGRA